jgi:hypothetical protein
MKSRVRSVAVSVVVLLAVAGCGPSETPESGPTPTSPGAAAAARVTSLELGRSVNPDKTMHDATVIFKPGDTVYASIILEGNAPTVAVKGRFTGADGQPIQESTQNLPVAGRAVTEFHVARSDGWPVGRYNFEVLLDGSPAASKEFEVEP